MKKLLTNSINPLALAVSLCTITAVVPQTASAEMTGNIGIHSKYLLRGIFEENDSTAVQGGLDWSNDGFYLGWWFSNLGYEYDAGKDTDNSEKGFENDFYGGYVFKFTDDISLDLGLTQYAYINVDDSNLTEFNTKVSVYDFYVKMQYLLTDGWWGNSGDIYWTMGYSISLPKDFRLDLDYGYYTYDDSDNRDLCNPDPSGCGVTTQTSGFRNFGVKLSYPVGKTGAEVYAQYVFAGENRSEQQYDDSMLVGVTYNFDL
jgi:uncharacterized protein (TIGR02001 family)